jgi:acyl dehydratase/acyl-coenzyme A thioesterase PaaI-like protein
MTTTRTLDGAPGAATLYPRAVAGSYALPLLRRVPLLGGWAGSARDGSLPDVVLELPAVELDRARVADYARVCGFALRDELPVTYLHVLAFPLSMRLMTDSAFPFGVLGLVHVANRIDHHRPVRLDETPALRVHAGALRDHAKGRQFDVVAEATIGGERVWEGRSTYLRPGGGGGKSNTTKKSADDRPAAPQAEALWDVPGDIGRRYGAVSGDRNPIHLHHLSAKAFGMPRAIAHGMWLKARCLAALEGQLPDALSVEVAFKLPLLLPAKVGFASWQADGGRDFAVHDARNGKPHLTGSLRPA